MIEFNIQYPETKAIFAIFSALISYYCYLHVISLKVVEKYFKGYFTEDSYQIRKILFNKLSGFLFFALLPGLIFFSAWQIPGHFYGIAWGEVFENWYWLIGLPALLITMNYFSAQNPDMYLRYPQMRLAGWKASTFLLSASGWTTYLIGYEFLFRGILLFSCVEAFGVWPAIAINVAIYSAIHLTNGMKETLGAIPFGLVACWFVVTTGSLIIPIIMHISLSVSTEFFTIQNNPEMKFVKNPNR